MDSTAELNNLSSLPIDLRSQVEDVAKNFAIALKNSSAGTAVEIPDWLSIKAQNWILSHSDEFSAYVICQYRRIMKGEEKLRPTFILPDPDDKRLRTSVGCR